MPSLGEYYIRSWANAVLEFQKAAIAISMSSMRRMLSAGGTTEPFPDLAGRRSSSMAAIEGFEERVRQRAYQIWLEEGRPDGRDKEHWERAKAEIEQHQQEQDSGASREPPPIPGPYENIS
jgi:hypothetical protein